jgi:ribosomal protein S6--L-glutamate ligase
MQIQEKTTIGCEEWLALPEIGLPAIKAKIDTGAKTSALHAFHIRPYLEGKVHKVQFGIHPIPDRPDIVVYCTAKLIGQREVISSNGEAELRYIIRTSIQLGTQKWPVEISLTNRETMTYRMLLGRSAMEHRLHVDPTASCLMGELSVNLYEGSASLQLQKRILKIGILSREANSYSTQRLVVAAQKRGHNVEVINTTRCYINITSSMPEIHLEGRVLDTYDAIIPRIGSSITFYGLAVVRQFEMMGTYCQNSSIAIGRSRDKLYAHQLLARSGIGMPVTSFAHSPDDTRDLLKIVGGAPVIIKLLEGTQGRGVVLAETPKAAESAIGAFQGLKANFLVQEFIKEAGGADIRCLVIGNKVVASIKRQAAEDEFRSNLHRGGFATRIRITPQERATALKAVRVLGLKIAGVDLLRSHDGPKVLEVNSSPGLEGIETTTGKDIAGMIIEHIEKYARPVFPEQRSKSKK